MMSKDAMPARHRFLREGRDVTGKLISAPSFGEDTEATAPDYAAPNPRKSISSRTPVLENSSTPFDRSAPEKYNRRSCGAKGPYTVRPRSIAVPLAQEWDRQTPSRCRSTS